MSQITGTARRRSWLAPRFTLRALFLALTVLGLLLSYTGSYVARSWRGRYEPAVIGLGGVKWYDWAPDGFVTEFRWNAEALRFYYPLWRLDRRFWHPPVNGPDGSPINEVREQDIGTVYEAWK